MFLCEIERHACRPAKRDCHEGTNKYKEIQVVSKTGDGVHFKLQQENVPQISQIDADLPAGCFLRISALSAGHCITNRKTEYPHVPQISQIGADLPAGCSLRISAPICGTLYLLICRTLYLPSARHRFTISRPLTTHCVSFTQNLQYLHIAATKAIV